MWGYHAKCESKRLQNKEVFTLHGCKPLWCKSFWDRFDYSRGYRPLSAAAGCRDDTSERFTPVTVPEKSDAELAAEGRSCSQQWRRARSETLSGSSNDVQLRATVYACDTPGDWVLGAIDNGEYSAPLLDVICYSERRAPACN